LFSEQLKQILKLKHTGDSETLNVPVKGTLEKPKFELGRALADIAKIRAKEEAVKRLPDLAARIAQAALDELTKKAFAGPPPLDASVDPLPWEKPRR
jgi:hypothetical protein